VLLPDGLRLSTTQGPVPPVAHYASERREEIQRRRAIVPADLRVSPDFAVDSPVWDTYHRRHVLLDKRRKTGFLGNKD
jgi:hypothetical protein